MGAHSLSFRKTMCIWDYRLFEPANLGFRGRHFSPKLLRPIVLQKLRIKINVATSKVSYSNNLSYEPSK